MSGAAFTPEELAIALFLYLVLPLVLPTLVGGIAGKRIEDTGMSTGLLLGAMASVVGFCFISMWWSSGLITVRVPWGALDEDFFIVPMIITAVASGVAWAGVWFWSQRD